VVPKVGGSSPLGHPTANRSLQAISCLTAGQLDQLFWRLGPRWVRLGVPLGRSRWSRMSGVRPDKKPAERDPNAH